MKRQPGNLHTVASVDHAECEDPSDGEAYQPEFLHSLTPSGMPPHKLSLKEGCMVMLLRNLDTVGGLCNGTRLIVRSIQEHFLQCDTLDGARVFIPKIMLRPNNTDLPFQLCRTQFPVRLAYSFTINKAQGQTLEYAGVLLEQPVFGHGQLYVALSRARSFDRIRVKILETDNQGFHDDVAYTTNVVYRQVLLD